MSIFKKKHFNPWAWAALTAVFILEFGALLGTQNMRQFALGDLAEVHAINQYPVQLQLLLSDNTARIPPHRFIVGGLSLNCAIAEFEQNLADDSTRVIAYRFSKPTGWQQSQDWVLHAPAATLQRLVAALNNTACGN
jgi:hypothetical protein